MLDWAWTVFSLIMLEILFIYVCLRFFMGLGTVVFTHLSNVNEFSLVEPLCG